MLNTSELLAVFRDGLLNDTVPFWTKHSPDTDFGGFLTFLDYDGSVFGTDKPVWLQGRIAWMYARLYNCVEKRQQWLELSRHALDFVLNHCFDADGRLFFLMTREGLPLRKRRYVFAEIFMVFGLAEYAVASGEDWARQKAADLFDVVIKYHETPGLLEPKWNSETRPTLGHAMPMILLATTQVIRQVDDRPTYAKIADQAIETVFSDFLRHDLRAVLEEVSPGGGLLDTPEGRCILPGHAIETAWFIMEEGRARGDRSLALSALPLLEYSLERGWDAEYGGLLYYVDLHDKPRSEYQWDMKLWWPHTEVIYATLLAFHLTGDPKWAQWYRKVHDYTYRHFPDPENGEWFGYLHRDGTIANRAKGNLWKGPYHLSRMQLNCWKLLEEMQTASQ